MPNGISPKSFDRETIAAVNAAWRNVQLDPDAVVALDGGDKGDLVWAAVEHAFDADNLPMQAARVYHLAAFLLGWAERIDTQIAAEMTPRPEPQSGTPTPPQERHAGMSPAYAWLVAGGSQSTSPPATHDMDCGVAGGLPHPATACEETA